MKTAQVHVLPMMQLNFKVTFGLLSVSTAMNYRNTNGAPDVFKYAKSANMCTAQTKQTHKHNDTGLQHADLQHVTDASVGSSPL